MRSLLKQACLGLTLLLATAPLAAQASRTWVSGVGDDANPGSRTAPCKTFAGAISKTAAGGEIDCLDPGGFGAVTITKAITLDGGGGQVASILVAGTNAINVSAGANDVVILRNIRFQGIGLSASPGLNGVRFNSGKALIIENCTFDGFSDAAIDVAVTTAGSTVSVSNVLETGLPAAATSEGVYLEAAANSQTRVDVSNSSFWNNGNCGIKCGAGTLVANNVTTTGCIYGVDTFNSPNVELDNTNMNSNTTDGLRVSGGTLRLSNCTITGNTAGVLITGGVVNTFGNNRIAGNGSGNGPLGGTLATQ
ncbi:MAG TPA: right-handed parallel beta-helix repeat-containing protein [Holophagaceae bacterium]|nr:right-handed parallel beta-helix repeat-containing protein [Holophagaceae bacterium]